MLKGTGAQDASTLSPETRSVVSGLRRIGYWPESMTGNGPKWTPAELRDEIGEVSKSLDRNALVALLWVASALAIPGRVKM